MLDSTRGSPHLFGMYISLLWAKSDLLRCRELRMATEEIAANAPPTMIAMVEALSEIRRSWPDHILISRETRSNASVPEARLEPRRMYVLQ